MATGVSMRVTKYEHTEVARSSATLLRYEGDRGGTRHRDKTNYNLLFTITINNFWDSDDNWIKFKKEMPFRVDLHWCLILWFWLRDDDLLYLKRSRRSRARNFSAFWLLNSYLVGLSPIRWDESEVVLRNVRYTTQFSSLRFYLKVSVDDTFVTYQGTSSISFSDFDWNLWVISRFELQAAPHSCFASVEIGFIITL